METLEIEAESRAEAVRKLRAMGVVSLELKEVRGQGVEVRGGRARRNVVLAVAGVAVLTGIGVWFYFPQSSQVPQKQERKTIKKVSAESAREKKSATAEPRKSAESVRAQETTEERKIDNALPFEEYLGKKVVKYSIITNQDGRTVETIWTADGGKHGRIGAAPSVFDNASDQLLAMAVSAPPGQMPPPLPMSPGIDRDFEASLKRPIVINDDDPPNVRAMKEAVIQARADMQELIRQGMTVQEVLRRQQQLQTENAATRAQVVKELKEIIASGDIEGARKYVRQMNVALGQMGIMGVSMPPLTAEEKADRRARARAERESRKEENRQ